MSWLTPLGFLGFIGLLILLLIYILKPNFQNKFISSTFVWKLSLKFKKKRIPISKLRNILLIICQILAVCTCAFILAQPFIDGEDEKAAQEKIIVIDASAGMQSELEGETRFERAVTEAKTLANDAMNAGGSVSVILAAREASFVVQRLDASYRAEVMSGLDSLVDPSDTKCTWGNVDIDGAMLLAESVLELNAKAEVVLFTGTSYIDDGKVTVRDVSDPEERNVSILDVRAVMDENYYRIELDMASYGNNYSGMVYVEVKGAYGTYGTGDSSESFNGGTLSFSYGVDLIDGERTKYRFGAKDAHDITDLKIYAYDSIRCYIDPASEGQIDTIFTDNTYTLFGGTPEELKIQYYSTMSNNFVSGMLHGLRDMLRSDWDIEIDEIKDSWENSNSGMGKEENIEIEGYDIYIFEHHVPKKLPTDGLVILLNPDAVPKGTDFMLGNTLNIAGSGVTLSAGETHPIMDYVNAENITVSRYTKITSYDSGYTPLMFIDNSPVVLAKNQPDAKMLVVSFNFHYSNFPIIPEYPTFLYNVLDYFMPTTFDKDVYQLYDKVTLNSRSENLTVSGPAFEDTLEFNEFPAEIHVDAPGTYTVTQIPISGVQVEEHFTVVIPEEQCNITREEDTLTNPYYPPVVEEVDLDLVFYFAIALVALLFCEWWLKSRDN